MEKNKSIEYEENKHSIDKIQSSDLIIKSPGIPNSADIIIKIKSLEIPIISEIEFASTNSNSFKICITGTNGKTTVTHMLQHILQTNNIKRTTPDNGSTVFPELSTNFYNKSM